MISFSPHIAVGVRDYNNALDFYTNTLGFTMQKFHAQESELRCGELTLHIERNKGEQATWLEFRVDDIATLKPKLETAGCALHTTNLEKSYLVVDPYGMRFHPWEEPEKERVINKLLN